MNDAAIPDDILALSQQFCRELMALISRTVDQPLSTLEDGVHEVLRQLATGALTLVVQRTQRSLGPARRDAAAACPHCETPTPIHSVRERTFQTTCGAVTVQRPWHHCRPCRLGFSPTDQTLEVRPRQRLSAHLRARAATLGALTSFEEAAVVLTELTGIVLPAEAARRGALDIVGWEGGIRERGLARLRPVTVVGDGAHWIWDLAATHFGERTEVVDWYHASQHVWEVAKALHPPPPHRRSVGRGTAQGALGGKCPHHAEGLPNRACPPPEAAELLRREHQYFLTNASRMGYPALRRTEHPIGSDAAESAAKHLIQQRLKRAGARWGEPGAQALIALRCQRAAHLALAA